MTNPELNPKTPDDSWKIEPNESSSSTILLKEDTDPVTGVTRQIRKHLAGQYPDGTLFNYESVTDIFPAGLPKRKKIVRGVTDYSYWLNDQMVNGIDRGIVLNNFKPDITEINQFDFSMWMELTHKQLEASEASARYREDGSLKHIIIGFSTKSDVDFVRKTELDTTGKLKELAQVFKLKGFDVFGGDILSLESMEAESEEILGKDLAETLILQQSIEDKREKGWSDDSLDWALNYSAREIQLIGRELIEDIEKGDPTFTEEELRRFLGRVAIQTVVALPDDFKSADGFDTLTGEDQQFQIFKNTINSVLDRTLDSYYRDLKMADNFGANFDFPENQDEIVKVSIRSPKSSSLADLNLEAPFEKEVKLGESVTYEERIYTVRERENDEILVAVQNTRKQDESFSVVFPSKVDIAQFEAAVATEDRVGWEKGLDLIQTEFIPSA